MVQTTYSFVKHNAFVYGGSGLQTRAAISAVRNGTNDGWIVVWEDSTDQTADIQGDFFNVAGNDDVSLTSPLSSNARLDQTEPDIAQSNVFSANGLGGSLLLVFTDESSGTARVAARTLSGLNGNPVGDDFFVSPTANVPMTNAAVAGLSRGPAEQLPPDRFVVTWESAATAQGNRDIYARVVQADGSLGNTITVANTSGDERNAHVVGLKDGGFLVAYQTAGANLSVAYQRYDSAGVSVGGPVTL